MKAILIIGLLAIMAIMLYSMRSGKEYSMMFNIPFTDWFVTLSINGRTLHIGLDEIKIR